MEMELHTSNTSHVPQKELNKSQKAQPDAV